MPNAARISPARRLGRVTGAKLAGLVLYGWRELPEPQQRALMCMALKSLDEPYGDIPAALYWGGHERIATTFRTWPADDSPHSPEERARRRKNVLREVRRAVAGLEAAGAVKVADPSRVVYPGRSQAYLLTLVREAA